MLLLQITRWLCYFGVVWFDALPCESVRMCVRMGGGEGDIGNIAYIGLSLRVR